MKFEFFSWKMSQKRLSNESQYLFVLVQVFHKVLDVTDMYRVRERNAVRLKMQTLQVSAKMFVWEPISPT